MAVVDKLMEINLDESNASLTLTFSAWFFSATALTLFFYHFLDNFNSNNNLMSSVFIIMEELVLLTFIISYSLLFVSIKRLNLFYIGKKLSNFTFLSLIAVVSLLVTLFILVTFPIGQIFHKTVAVKISYLINYIRFIEDLGEIFVMLMLLIFFRDLLVGKKTGRISIYFIIYSFFLFLLLIYSLISRLILYRSNLRFDMKVKTVNAVRLSILLIRDLSIVGVAYALFKFSNIVKKIKVVVTK